MTRAIVNSSFLRNTLFITSLRGLEWALRGNQSEAPTASLLIRLFLVLHVFHVHRTRVATTAAASCVSCMVPLILGAFFHLHIARSAATTCSSRIVSVVLCAFFHVHVA